MSERAIKRALISVSDKHGLVPFARQLSELGIEIISTGGTSALLREHQIAVQDVADITGFPEIMDGRVKTLHPHIHGGILGKRKEHADIARRHGIEWIDLVVVNLYPFAEVIQKTDTSFAQAIENIDIGGPGMIRSAAKNMADVTVVVDPADYSFIIEQIQTHGAPVYAQRQALAQKAFQHTAQYDGIIANYLAGNTEKDLLFPDNVTLSLNKISDLRYGENPSQKACAYRLNNAGDSILDAQQHQGKALSYNNIVDADATLNCVSQFTSTPACVIVKHANPCGVACGTSILEAFERALAADPTSAFGGIVALNQNCDAATAKALSSMFLEVIIAPDFSAEALECFKQKPNLRVLALKASSSATVVQYQWVAGLLLAQEINNPIVNEKDLEVVTQRKPSDEEMKNLLFAWNVVRHVKSNAIVITQNEQTLGIGPGQVSRIDAVHIAINKAGSDLSAAGLASDAFFPFKDSIEPIARAGIKAIIQPGGSIRDQEVIDACNAHGIAMVFTGIRCFRH